MSVLAAPRAFADEAEPRPVFGEHPGYTTDVADEKDKRDLEMVLIPKPAPTHAPISKVIFDEKLTKEFQDQYRYRFGETPTEQGINNPARTGDGYTYYNTQSITVQDYQKYQLSFANYMLRRLGEYHLDKLLKEEPSLKGVGEFKERVSDVKVETKSGYKFNFNANLSGPTINLGLENPYKIQNRVQLMLGQHDAVASIGYNITPKWSFEVLYRHLQNLEQVVVTRKISKHVLANFTASAGLLPGDTIDYQDLYLIGITYILYP